MPLSRQIAQPTHYIIDPQRDGVHGLWKDVTGAVTVASSKYRFNADEGLITADLLYATVDFMIKVPLTGVQTPTDLVNDIDFGLKNLSLGNRGKIQLLLDKSEDSFSLVTYSDTGGASSITAITWQTAWNGQDILCRVNWDKKRIYITIDVEGVGVAVNVDHQTADSKQVGSFPLNPYVRVVGAENLDVSFIAIRNAQRSSIIIA